jgi:bacteriorhodopsin
MIPWLLISVGVLILVFLVLFIVARKKQKNPTDYYRLFTLGVIWVGAGTALGVSANNWALFFVGLVFMVIGLIHKKEWKKNIADRKKNWGSMNVKDKKILICFKWILFFVLLIGLIAFLLTSGFI